MWQLVNSTVLSDHLATRRSLGDRVGRYHRVAAGSATPMRPALRAKPPRAAGVKEVEQSPSVATITRPSTISDSASTAPSRRESARSLAASRVMGGGIDPGTGILVIGGPVGPAGERGRCELASPASYPSPPVQQAARRRASTAETRGLAMPLVPRPPADQDPGTLRGTGTVTGAASDMWYGAQQRAAASTHVGRTMPGRGGDLTGCRTLVI
jgi:hypothetical protein